jgi:exonuclease III
MKIISFNVNGIRAIEKKGELRNLLQREKPDLLFLQEIKAKPEQLSDNLLNPEGYEAHYHRGAARQVAQALRRNNFSAFADDQFRCAGEKSRRIRARMAPRGANSQNLRRNSSRLGYLRGQKSCTSDLPRSP